MTDGDNGFGVIQLIIRGPNKAPMLQSTYSFSISEGAANGDSVGTISYTDEGMYVLTDSKQYDAYLIPRVFFLVHVLAVKPFY